MSVYQVALLVATLLCSLVAGFLFSFATVVMPGIGRLNNREFLHAFQVMDRVIQNNQPVFTLVWIGSILAIITVAALGIKELNGAERLLIVVTTLTYLLGVQLPTVTINVPLNNKIQSLETDTADEATQIEARKSFESRWNRSNSIRTCLAVLVSILLLLQLLRA